MAFSLGLEKNVYYTFPDEFQTAPARGSTCPLALLGLNAHKYWFLSSEPTETTQILYNQIRVVSWLRPWHPQTRLRPVTRPARLIGISRTVLVSVGRVGLSLLRCRGRGTIRRNCSYCLPISNSFDTETHQFLPPHSGHPLPERSPAGQTPGPLALMQSFPSSETGRTHPKRSNIREERDLSPMNERANMARREDQSPSEPLRSSFLTAAINGLESINVCFS